MGSYMEEFILSILKVPKFLPTENGAVGGDLSNISESFDPFSMNSDGSKTLARYEGGFVSEIPVRFRLSV